MSNRKLYALLTVTALLLIITLGSPLLVRWQLGKQLQGLGAEQVRIEGLYLNIWTGFFRLQGLEATAEGRPELILGHLELDLDMPALFQRRLHLGHLQLFDANTTLIQNEAGWQLGPLALPAGGDDEPASEAAEESGWSWGLSQLALKNLQLAAVQHTRTQTLRIDQASLDLLHKWSPDRESRLSLEAELNGSTLALGSTATPLSLTPRAESQLRIDNLDLGPLLAPWLAEPVSGRLSTDLVLGLDQTSDALVLEPRGSVTLTELGYGPLAGDRLHWQGTQRATLDDQGLQGLTLEGELSLLNPDFNSDALSIHAAEIHWQGDAELARQPEQRLNTHLEGKLDLTDLALRQGDQLELSNALLSWQGTQRATLNEQGLQGLTLEGALSLLNPDFNSDALSIQAAKIQWQGDTELARRSEQRLNTHLEGKLDLTDLALRQSDQLELSNALLSWRGNAALGLGESGLEDLDSRHDLTLENLSLSQDTLALTESQLRLAGTLAGDMNGLAFTGEVTGAALEGGLDDLTFDTGPLRWQGELSADLQTPGLAGLSGDAHLEALQLGDKQRQPLARVKQLTLEELQQPEPGLFTSRRLALEALQLEADNKPLLTLDKAELDQLATGPRETTMESLTLGALTTGVRLDPDGSPRRWLDWAAHFGATASTAKASPEAPSAQEAAPQTPPYPVRLDRLSLAEPARLSFLDTTVSPARELNLTLNQLQLEQLDTTSEAPGPFSLQGQVNRFGELALEGRYSWFASPPSGDWSGHLRQLELPPFSPYVERHVGYQLQSGQLQLQTRGSLDQGQVQSRNELTIHNLQVRRQSEEEAGEFDSQLGMPLETVVSILTDEDDNLTLQVPVNGSLDDPRFGYQSVINIVMTKVAKQATIGYLTATLQPYGALISLTRMAIKKGSAIELAPVFFPPGSTDFDAEAKDYLGKLESLLREREGIRLNLCGTAVAADARTLLSEAAQDTASGAAASPPAELDSAQLLALHDLAQQRADRVKTHLQQQGIEGERLFGCLPRVDITSEEAPRVLLAL